MKFQLSSVVAVLAIATIVAACNKPEPEPTPTENQGAFEIEFEYLWGMDGSPFGLNTPLHHPMTGDTLTFSTFKHYIGHVTLEDVNGESYTDADAYALFDASDPTTLSLRVTGVPEGDYASMTLTLGVDSARNVSGAQSGALDPMLGMFWSWNSGYIMIKAEGTSPQSETGTFVYHLGGFSGENAVQSRRTFDLTSHGLLSIRSNASPVVHCFANPAKLFHTYGSVANGPIQMPGSNAGIMGQDFHGGVYIDHIHP